MATAAVERPDLITLVRLHIIFDKIAVNLSLDCAIALGQTCKLLRALVWEERSRCFRYADLSGSRPHFLPLPSLPGDTTSAPIIRHLHLTETPEETRQKWLMTGLYRSLKRLQILPRIHTLILDEQYLLFPLLSNLLHDEALNIKILSVLNPFNCTNIPRLQMMLDLLVNRNQHQSPPMLEVFYCFGPSQFQAGKLQKKAQTRNISELQGVTSSPFATIGGDVNSFVENEEVEALSALACEQNIWYQNTGRVFPRNSIHHGWANCLFQCEGNITFDAVLCRGPRHGKGDPDYDPGHAGFLGPRIADIAFGSQGCEFCGTCPEGPAVWGKSPSHWFPALRPVPTQVSTLKAAQAPPMIDDEIPSTILRCSDCMKGRWCEQCNKWWCEDCYYLPGPGNPIVRVEQGLCVEKCLPQQLMSGAGSGGMWG